jgi:phage terminase large subunit-like protein
MAKLVFERAIHVDELGEFSSYWPDYWPMKKLADRWSEGADFFAAGYQNDPSALEGTLLKAEWVRWYLPDELKEARARAGIDPNTGTGTIHIGVDTAAGGIGVNPDYCAGVGIEVIENRGYILPEILNERLPVETQAPRIEQWADLIHPNFAVIEETSARGFVKTALLTQINNGLGSKYAFTSETPQSKSAGGDKSTRFLSMSPRFMSGQILAPGIMTETGEVMPDPRIRMWFSEWKSCPSGHDDLLDATYWAQYSAFKDAAAVGITKDVDGHIAGALTIRELITTVLICEREAHVAFGKPLGECVRCSFELGVLAEPQAEGIGVPRYSTHRHHTRLLR